MQPGRSPSWNVVSTLMEGAWLDIVEVATSGRVLLPLALRRRLTWAQPEGNLQLLATVSVDGGAMLRPLDSAQGELDTVRRVLATSDRMERTSLIFAAFASHSRIALQPDGRLRLSPTLATQLEVGPKDLLWVGAAEDRVWLWSQEGFQRFYETARRSLDEVLGANDVAA